MPRRKSRSQAMVDAFRSLFGSGSVSYFTDDSFEGMASELAAQIGGTTSTTYNFTNGTGTRLADNDTVYAALNKLDQGFVDLKSTANAKGASLVGIEDAGSLFTAANVEAALAEVKTLSNAALCRPVISIGAESGDAITVTIQLKGVNGVNVAREQLLEVWFVCTDPDVMFTAAPTGTLLGGGGNRAYVTTDATGLAVLTLTDTTPNYAGTGGLIVTPMSDGTDAFVGFPAFTTATFA